MINLKGTYLFPPASAVEVLESVLSVCASVCVYACVDPSWQSKRAVHEWDAGGT